MIDVKEAVKKAAKFLCEVFAEEELHEVRLEEIDRSEDDAYWYVTLSFLRSKPGSGSEVSDLRAILQPPPEREYKVFTVRHSDGEVHSMKIRHLAVTSTIATPPP